MSNPPPLLVEDLLVADDPLHQLVGLYITLLFELFIVVFIVFL
jgi:hypothetical protein